MFWRKAKAELNILREEADQANRDKEAARLNFQRSLARLATKLEELPIEEGLEIIGRDLGRKGPR